MIGLSLLSSVSKHNMWSYYDWVVVVFQQRPNHNTTTYCVYWRKTTQSYYDRILCLLTDDNNDPIIIRPHIVLLTKDNPVILRPHIVFTVWLGSRCRRSVNTICGRIMIGLSLLSSVSKHNMWSYYDWVVVVFRPAPSSKMSSTEYRDVLIPILFTDGRQRQPNHNTTTYCVYWRTTTTTTQS
jgi:hypothetical protein